MSEATTDNQDTFLPFIFTPLDWYWVAENGRVYSSARGALVRGTDAGFKAFKKGGGIPTPWPRDEAGAESDAELDNVLRPYRLSLAGPLSEPVITFKADIWRRATDAEAETLDTLLSAQPVRLRNMYRDALQIDHSDELFPLLLSAMTDAFGADRATDLLASS